MDRRDFLQTSIGAGFAAAVLPTLTEATILTDSSGLDAGTVNIKSADFSMPVYVARPATKQPLPVILVVSEIFGVHAHIADIARRFAKLGYLAIAPDLFARQGDPTVYTSIPELFKDIIVKVPDVQVMQDLDACAHWAAAHGGDASRMGITGFCWGGRITWLYAAHNPQLKAGVAWYGKLVQDKTPLQATNPIDHAAQLRVPVLGLYGGKDSSISLETVERMRAELAKGKSGTEFVIYPEAGHAFHADYRPSYVEADAKDGWLRATKWFSAHGV